MSLKLNILASWIAHVIMVAIGFYMVPYVRNTLPNGDYGVWVFVNSLASYSSLLYMGMGATVCRYVARYHTQKDWDTLNRFASTVFSIFAGVALSAIGEKGKPLVRGADALERTRLLRRSRSVPHCLHLRLHRQAQGRAAASRGPCGRST